MFLCKCMNLRGYEGVGREHQPKLSSSAIGWAHQEVRPLRICHLTLTQALQLPESKLQPRKKRNMAPKLELPSAALMVGLLFFSLIPPAEAYDAGDGLALLLCTILTVVGFCACLGWYARRRNGQLWRWRDGILQLLPATNHHIIIPILRDHSWTFVAQALCLKDW